MGSQGKDADSIQLGSSRPPVGDRRDHSISASWPTGTLLFQIHDQNVNFETIIGFIAPLHEHLRRKFILALDRYSAHRKAVRLLQAEHPDWFEVEWLPGYAPDLNPTEMVWNHSKYSDLANFIPEDVVHLQRAVTASLESMRSEHQLLRSFNTPNWRCDRSICLARLNST